MTVKNFGEVELKIFETREEMGSVAAKEAADRIQELLEEKQEINCIFAAAPSQNDFLKGLVEEHNIEWNRVNCYQMDEYIGYGKEDSESFANFLNNAIFGKVPFKSVNLLNGLAEDPEGECDRYAALLKKNHIDIVFMGIGENGHIAFNDPSVADFEDQEIIKIVKLEESCRMQQVHDGCFPSIDDVPKKAITLTIPTLLSGDYIFCIVPTANKANAVASALKGEISENCPASVLRVSQNVKMYIDEDCASKL